MLFFPSMFHTMDKIEMFEDRRKRIIAICENALIDSESARSKVEEIEKRLIEMVLPKNFMGENSEEVNFEKNFQFLCHSLNEHTNKEVKKMTVLEVYSLIELLKKREKQNVKSNQV